MSITQREDRSYLSSDLSTRRPKLQEDQRRQEKLVIAQPIFIFEKEKQTFKRPAEDTLYEVTKHECNSFSRKRIRSSSFTLQTTDLQSRGGKSR
uniref:Uncharacterized protein n=1 Tax=Jaculus jaculus TaxID=51337 RepID=A0A8C5K887_JACJA